MDVSGKVSSATAVENVESEEEIVEEVPDPVPVSRPKKKSKADDDGSSSVSQSSTSKPKPRTKSTPYVPDPVAKPTAGGSLEGLVSALKGPGSKTKK